MVATGPSRPKAAGPFRTLVQRSVSFARRKVLADRQDKGSLVAGEAT